MHLIGGLSLFCLGLGVWTTIFYCIHIFDILNVLKFPLINKAVPVALILVIWLLIVSWSNKEHPVRLPYITCCKELPTTNEYFDKWIQNRIPEDTAKAQLINTCGTCVKTRFDTIPVIFVNAEGGALRTGCFSALMLSALNDHCIGFRNKVFAYSTVSGGTTGVNFYNCLINEYDEKHDIGGIAREYYLKEEFLSAVMAKLMFSEILGHFIPVYFENFDRAISLENVWEKAWTNNTKSNHPNRYSECFYSEAKTDGLKPAIFINSTEVERGRRAIVSNINLQDKNTFSNITDINTLSHYSLAYSTAIGLSARFPLISPSGMIKDGDKKYHFVDGGYFENLGATTLKEVIDAVCGKHYKSKKNNNIEYVIRPLVLHFSIDAEEEPPHKNINLANEIVDILSTAINTRGGRTRESGIALEKCVENKYNGCLVDLNVFSPNKEVPVNWVLSKKAVLILIRVVHQYIFGNSKNTNIIKKHLKLMKLLKISCLNCQKPKY